MMNKKRYIPKKFLGGALLNVGMGLVQNHLNDRQERRLANQEMHQSRADNFDNTLVPTQQFTPTFQCGGKMKKKYGMGGQFEKYTGQTHDGPDEGIPVDETGSPTQQTGGQAVALTEDGEYKWTLEDGSKYIFGNLPLPGSTKRTFADEADRIHKMFKLRLGKKMDKHDPISQDAMAKALDELMMIQETVKGNTVHQEDMEMALEQQAMEMQEMQGQQEQPMSSEEEMMMQEQMAMEQGMEQPMMKYGGKLKKYQDGDYLTPSYNANIASGPTSMGYMYDANIPAGQTSMGRTHNINHTAGPTSTDLGSVPLEAGADAWMGGVNPLAAGIPIAANLIGMGMERRNERNRKQFNPGVAMANKMDISSELAQARNIVASTRGQSARNAKNAGATGSNLMAHNIAGNLGSQRLAGELTTNINRMKQEYDLGELGRVRELNMQNNNISQQYNLGQKSLFDQRQSQYVANIGSIGAGYYADDANSRGGAALANMQSDNLRLTQNPDQKWWQRSTPQMSLRKTRSRTSRT